MIGAMARHGVQVLRAAGKTLKETAAAVGVSQRSVQRIELERPLETVADLLQSGPRGVGRPSVAGPWRERVVAVLAAEPALPTMEILHRLREERYAGGKTALYELVRELRPKPMTPLVRFEGVAGEFSQHDFGQVEVRYLDGTHERVHFFVSRLKYSRWVDVRVVENEGVESLVRSLLAGFESFGGEGNRDDQLVCAKVADRCPVSYCTLRCDGSESSRSIRGSSEARQIQREHGTSGVKRDRTACRTVFPTIGDRKGEAAEVDYRSSLIKTQTVIWQDRMLFACGHR